jgi:hypothetical protein
MTILILARVAMAALRTINGSGVVDDRKRAPGKISGKIDLRRRIARGLFELAVDAQLNAADRQQVDPGLRFAGFDRVADPELPFPDPRRCRRNHAVFHAFVSHGTSPDHGKWILRRNQKLHLFNRAHFREFVASPWVLPD